VTNVVLTVPEGALSVLPGLTPLNRGQRNEEALAALKKRRPFFIRKHGALFECVFAWRVVKDAPVVD